PPLGPTRCPYTTLFRSQLSARQRQCLELAAQGKDEWTIGRLLNLAECTVHKHIGNAKRKLGVATRTQAVVEALATRQISFGDVVDRKSTRLNSSHVKTS